MSEQGQRKLSRIPRHSNPTRPDRTALAPYNFVPLPDRLIAFPAHDNPLLVTHDRYHEDRITGWIDVKLETKSPLYIRGPLSEEEFQLAEKEADKNDSESKKPHLQKVRNKPNFFYTVDPETPVIPGSSLRGMVRSMVEILSHGKLSPVTDNRLVYRAVGDTTSHGTAYRNRLFMTNDTREKHYIPRFEGGYIRRYRNEWHIQPAKKIKGASNARIANKRIPKGLEQWNYSRNAKRIYVQAGPNEFQPVKGGFIHIKHARILRAAAKPGQGLQEAALANSGRMFSKRSEAVIFAGEEDEKKWIRIPNGTRKIKNEDGSESNQYEEDLVHQYIEQITPEQRRLLGIDEKTRKENNLPANDGVLLDKQPIFYLMEDNKLDCFFFGHTQMFRLPYLRSPQEMLPPEHRTEHLLDFAEAIFGRVSVDSETVAGRVFVSDAQMVPNQESPWLPDDPIVYPRILSGPKPTTFQHYLTQSKPDEKENLNTYNMPPVRSTLRGHKLYWHKGEVKRKQFAEDPKEISQAKDTQHTRIKPLRPGIIFQFRLRFENLSLPELGALWWALRLPVVGDYCHKLGMGKPLGLGAVELKPTLQIETPKKRYESLFTKGEGRAWFNDGLESSELSKKFADAALQTFEKFICRQQKIEEFARSKRVMMLLRMLSWPGPDPEVTRYMEIERPDPKAKRGKRNEYRDRPVLPDPLKV